MSRDDKRFRTKFLLWGYTLGFFGLLFLVGQAIWEGDFLVALLLAFIAGCVKGDLIGKWLKARENEDE